MHGISIIMLMLVVVDDLDLDLDPRAKWVGKGKDSALNCLDN